MAAAAILGVQQQSKCRKQYASRERYTYCVVDKGEEEISLMFRIVD